MGDALRSLRHGSGDQESCVRRPHPDVAWVLQVGRNVTDAFSGFLHGKHFLIMHRDGSFDGAFRGLLENARVQPVRTPARSPNCDAPLE
jgi:hypothetical protein